MGGLFSLFSSSPTPSPTPPNALAPAGGRRGEKTKRRAGKSRSKSTSGKTSK